MIFFQELDFYVYFKWYNFQEYQQAIFGYCLTIYLDKSIFIGKYGLWLSKRIWWAPSLWWSKSHFKRKCGFYSDPRNFDDHQVFDDPKGISIGSMSMNFDHSKVNGNTSIFDGLVLISKWMPICPPQDCLLSEKWKLPGGKYLETKHI